MPEDFLSFSQMYDAPDDERSEALVLQASLPSDYTKPSDALGDEAWAEAVRNDLATGGVDAEEDFRTVWDWQMTPQQRASALADVAFQRGMDAFINEATDASAKPPVDPAAYAESIRGMRAERARRM